MTHATGGQNEKNGVDAMEKNQEDASETGVEEPCYPFFGGLY